jgi:hypothetical protein
MNSECVMCEEAITNPICPSCLQQGVQQWLMEQQRNDLVSEIEELTVGVFANNGDAFCIKCDNLMSLCAYCYTKEVFHVVKKHPKLLALYVDYFNYDLELETSEVRKDRKIPHVGWSKEAELLLDY